MRHTLSTPHKVFPGDKFGRLTVVGFSHLDKRSRRHYAVRCECGTTKTVQGTLLRSGNTRSCGCLSVEARHSKRLPSNAGVINYLMLQYKRHARNRGIQWGLTRNQFESLVRGECRYCGEKSGNLVTTKNCREGFRYNGVDRKDPSGPYSDLNCVSCCGACNRAKGAMTSVQFISWIVRVYEHTKDSKL